MSCVKSNGSILQNGKSFSSPELYSWTSKKQFQQPQYPDTHLLEYVLDQLRNLPPLIPHEEIVHLNELLSECCNSNKNFIIQAGDCAERFIDSNHHSIDSRLKVLFEMSQIISHSSKKKVLKIGRIAGQYAKPRSKEREILLSQQEISSPKEVPSFRGDIIHSFDPDHRVPDPYRLLKAYHHSAETLKYIKRFTSKSESHECKKNLGDSDFEEELLMRPQEFKNSKYSESNNVGQTTKKTLKVDDEYQVWTSHEGLLLDYESCLTRRVGNEYYNQSAHFLWIGARTAHIHGAHVEYFSLVENPIGIKITPDLARNTDELIEIIQMLNPNKKKGKITLIPRLGVLNVEHILPDLIYDLQQSNCHNYCIWSCDPMHGNTTVHSNGMKVRYFKDIAKELESSVRIHSQYDSILGGIHLEVSGSEVTECVGGGKGSVKEEDLTKKYETYCDPRLNFSQSLELAKFIGGIIESSNQK